MNPAIRQRWIAALRSGTYRQGRGCLRSTDDRYCCLGVLIDAVYRADHPSLHWYRSNLKDRMEFMGDNAILPKVVSEWAGLPNEVELTLVRTNDHDKLTFEEIAELLERIDTAPSCLKRNEEVPV